jgi:hypothetical protein
MKTILFISMLVLLAGCSAEDAALHSGSGKDIKHKRLTIREIDSLTALENYSFSIQNKIEAVPAKNSK